MAFTISLTPAMLQCAGLACEAFVTVLTSDPRVQRAYTAWLTSPRRSDLAALESLVRDDLRLPYSWLPQMLRTAFAATAVSQATGKQIRVTCTPAESLPGRAAKGNGQYIRRDVEWYYQAEIKQPPVPKRQLAAEYQRTWTGRTVDPRGTVQTGIRRAKILLSIFQFFED